MLRPSAVNASPVKIGHRSENRILTGTDEITHLIGKLLSLWDMAERYGTYDSSYVNGIRGGYSYLDSARF